jgi:hypothetical protein
MAYKAPNANGKFADSNIYDVVNDSGTTVKTCRKSNDVRKNNSDQNHSRRDYTTDHRRNSTETYEGRVRRTRRLRTNSYTFSNSVIQTKQNPWNVSIQPVQRTIVLSANRNITPAEEELITSIRYAEPIVIKNQPMNLVFSPPLFGDKPIGKPTNLPLNDVLRVTIPGSWDAFYAGNGEGLLAMYYRQNITQNNTQNITQNNGNPNSIIIDGRNYVKVILLQNSTYYKQLRCGAVIFVAIRGKNLSPAISKNMTKKLLLSNCN